MCVGSAPNALAMVGRAVEITVLSMFCMKSAQATMSAVNRVRRAVRTGGVGADPGSAGWAAALSFIRNSIAARMAEEKPGG